MKRRGGDVGGGRGGGGLSWSRGGDRVPELPGSGGRRRPGPTTGHSKPAERGGVPGVALALCVHIWINYCFHETSVGAGCSFYTGTSEKGTYSAAMTKPWSQIERHVGI